MINTKQLRKGLYFVDKTELLEELIPALEQERDFSVSQDQGVLEKRFMANMIASFLKNRRAVPIFLTDLKFQNIKI